MPAIHNLDTWSSGVYSAVASKTGVQLVNTPGGCGTWMLNGFTMYPAADETRLRDAIMAEWKKWHDGKYAMLIAITAYDPLSLAYAQPQILAEKILTELGFVMAGEGYNSFVHHNNQTRLWVWARPKGAGPGAPNTVPFPPPVNNAAKTTTGGK